DDGGRDGDVLEVHELHAVELGDGGHDLVGGGVAEFEEGVLDLGPGLLGHGAGLAELVGAEDLPADEDVGEVAAVLGHETSPCVGGARCGKAEAAAPWAGREGRPKGGWVPVGTGT